MKKIVLVVIKLFFVCAIMFLADTFCMPRGQKKHIKRINAPHHWQLASEPELGTELQHQIAQTKTDRHHMEQFKDDYKQKQKHLKHQQNTVSKQ
jgi:hypothetical protein